MSYNFTQEDMSDFIDSVSTENDYVINFPKDIGSIKSQKKVISKDIIFFKSRFTSKKNIQIQSTQKVNGLYIGILLDGVVNYKDNLLKENITLKKNDIKISYINEFNMTTILNNHSQGIGLLIKNDFLEKNFSDIFESHSKAIQELPSLTLKNETSKNIHLAKELFNSPFKGNLHNIYIQSKILEIIYNECIDLTSHNKNINQKIKLSQEDIFALNKAKDIIMYTKEYPDINTLSKKVAINEFKLKYGFKKLFNTTPGSMILKYKMLYAKELLKSSEFSIYEISNFVGYKYQQNFTNAFIKYFGIKPKELIKQRKYYF
ncbi:AraC family transcriptional regulator [Malaciobacter molluscorum LMG 25693]|uniref:AraC family transcriptional regulator n=1 Tax=Malaciobacter molluscorum LMG 25693 TaxID=870501 RepID=A0A2G1DK66_9BACT|nr:AraC family transcriptional regulator [Malaciobacter molluscorum]AXX91382.1 transcriptional regulator, AraC family [Malaciobacter molluscorum LMG 25693]PHO18869.1 AraC family transcriptional regulator [Malaciobacter molluscorum LMG 25693]